MAMSDLTKVIIDTTYDAFKNNTIYTGTYQITGTSSGGTNTRSFTITLANPDMTDVVFNGPTDTVFSSDPRPADGWFKRGAVWVRGDNAGAGYNNYPIPWDVYTSIAGSIMTVTLLYVQQFSTVLTLTATDMFYRIVDYSVF